MSGFVFERNASVRLYHGTASQFEEFGDFDHGIHFGSKDTAAHAATIKLGRLPIEEFEKLEKDSHGWLGRIIEVDLLLAGCRVMKVEDPKENENWVKLIEDAKQNGCDAICYLNEFEGREAEVSWVVWDKGLIEIINPDLTRTAEPEVPAAPGM